MALLLFRKSLHKINDFFYLVYLLTRFFFHSRSVFTPVVDPSVVTGSQLAFDDDVFLLDDDLGQPSHLNPLNNKTIAMKAKINNQMYFK